jgi:hypothetical protein
MDIFSFPLYYISFKQSDEIEDHYKAFGFKNVKHFNAVNGRKMDIKKLLDDNIITIRAYDDILSGRTQHSGMTNMGAIGCTLSHYELWNKCVNDNNAFIIITEEDNRMDVKIGPEDIKKISDILGKEKSIMVSTEVKPLYNYKRHFQGLHFYIISKEACKELIKDCFPMDVQTDWYVSHIASQGKINIEGYPVSSQGKHLSSIQDGCMTCDMNKNRKGLFIKFLIFVVVCYIIFKVFFCNKTCKG